MSDFDWRTAIKSVAPTIGGLLTTVGGPAGALAGAGLVAVANALGVPATGDPKVDEIAVAEVMARGLSPEQQAALIAADLEYKRSLIAAGIREKEIILEENKSQLLDVADARAHNANTVGILRLGYFINGASYLCVALVLGCSFWLMGAKTEMKVDPGIAAMLGSIIGGTVQWLLSNAAQANSFFFGSSPRNRQSVDALAKAVESTPAKMAKGVGTPR